MYILPTDPVGVVELLDAGGRLQNPNNEACSQEMYDNAHSLIIIVILY